MLGAPATAAAQLPLQRDQKPTADEARAILQSRPDLVAKLREKVQASGLTSDQIRARLRAEGYPEDLLDPYLPGSTVAADSVGATDSVFAAVKELGLADSTEVDGLRRAALASTPQASDTIFIDSLAVDSLGRRLVVRRRVPIELGALARPDTGDVVFGLAVFARQTSQFEPNVAGPVDPSYRLGAGDQLVLILTGDVEVAHSLDVNREGFVVIPQVGQLYVANLTLGELENVLYSRLARVYSGVRRGPGATTRFHVTVSRLRTNQVFVVGDVAVPGSYRISSAGTVLTALYAAGGPSPNGSLRRVEVRRGGQLVDSLDVYDYLLRGDASRDVRLQSGDVVFVPVHGPQVRVTGEVTRPAIYELKRGEMLPDAIRAAGGFTPTALRTRIQVARVLPAAERSGPGRDRAVIDVACDTRAGELAPRFPLEAGDTVRVFRVSDRVRNRIAVLGNVWTPGSQGYAPGMRLSDALRAAGGLKPDVYLGQVLVSRLRPDSTRIQLRAALRDASGAPVNDLPLQEDDEIRVFGRTEFRPDRYVVVSGAVKHGGQYPYREGMTIRDLVLLAGGLEESAYLKEAEIARLPERRDGGQTAMSLRVPLDSSYLFERASDGGYAGPPGLPAPAGGSPDVTLRPYDNVLILRQPDWELQRLVVIQGQVRFPGRYSLLTKTERLSDLLRRAGGLTREAYADGVTFYRRQDRTGRVGVDLARVLKHPRSRDDLILQEGDSIYVPEYNPVVKIEGAVNSPGGVTYVPGARLDYYIRAAGGPSKDADLDRAYVRQSNGKVEARRKRRFLPASTPEPRAGSTVTVPLRDPKDTTNYVAAAGAVAQILAGMVAIVVALTRH